MAEKAPTTKDATKELKIRTTKPLWMNVFTLRGPETGTKTFVRMCFIMVDSKQFIPQKTTGQNNNNNHKAIDTGAQ